MTQMKTNHATETSNKKVLQEESDFYNKEYKIGYQSYMKSMENFREDQEKSNFYADNNQDKNHQSNLGMINKSLIEYIENVQQKQKQHFQNNQHSTSSSAHHPSNESSKTKLFSNNLFNTATVGTVKFKDINNELSNIILKG